MALTGTKALMVWCQRITNDYKDVDIKNMTSSWRDGLGFCAILNHYRPDLINFEKLSKENIAENNHLAFTVAENELGIPALLDVEDMVAMDVPDKLSIITYVSQFFNYFRDKVPGEITPAPRHSTKRPSPYTTDDLPKKKAAPGISAVKEVIGASPVPKLNKGTMDKYCAKCKETVYLMERFQVEGKLFHRVCFTCATCGVQLRMGTYRYIPIEDQFYCDSHYRKRTTSASSDELRTSTRTENQKSEQDALQSLLQSLENKRKVNEMPSEENSLKPTASLHERIGNARKMFMQAEQSSIGSEEKNTFTNSNDAAPTPPAKSQSKQSPKRPNTPPKLESKEVKEKQLFKSDRAESRSSEHIPARPLLSPMKKFSRSCDDLERNETDGKAPPRPLNLPQQKQPLPCHKTVNAANADLGKNDVANARGFLASVLPTLTPANSKPSAISSSQTVVDDNGGHIYETPFLDANHADNDLTSNEFENPRYGDKINMNPSVVYANEMPSLLTMEGRKMQDEEDHVMEDDELSASHACINRETDRIRADSVLSSCSEGERKKKLILKVKKKKKKSNDEQRQSTNLNEDVDEKMIEDDGTRNELMKESEKEESNVTETSDIHVEESSNLDEVKTDDVGLEENKFDQSRLDDNVEQFGEKNSGKAAKNIEEGRETHDENIEGNSFQSECHIENEEIDTAGNGIDEMKEAKDVNIQKEKELTDYSCSANNNDKEMLDKKSDEKPYRDKQGDNSHDDSNIDLPMSGSVANDKDQSDLHRGTTSQTVIKDESNEKIIVNSSQDILDGQRKPKVSKYKNPFEDSDDEILDAHPRINRKEKFHFNPFESMSDEEFPNEKTVSNSESGTKNVTPGEGPKIRVSSIEVKQHEKKITELKKAKYEKKKNTEYRNPFEDSDDDILDEAVPKQIAKVNDDSKMNAKDAIIDDKHHQKKLVLKKKKRQAPPRPNMAPSKNVTIVGSEGHTREMNQQSKETLNPCETVHDDSLDEKTLVTFKTYIENSQIELDKDKRLDNRPPERRKQSIGQKSNDPRQESGINSPVSSSCPSLIQNEDEDAIDFDKGLGRTVSTEEVANNPLDVRNSERLCVEQHDEAGGSPVLKKEKPPKRPAPPVPTGVKPFNERQEEIRSPKSMQENAGNGKTNQIIVKEEHDSGEIGEKKDGNKGRKDSKSRKKKDDKKEEIKKKKEDLKKNEKQKEEKKKGDKKKDEKKQNEKVIKNKKKELKNKNSDIDKQNEITKSETEIERQEIYFIEDQEYTPEEISSELKSIESEQRILEKKGVQMEKKLREQLHGEPEENYMVTWFDLITEKNKLLRRENELIYMSQEMEYHENQRRIEYELRLLMEKDESTRTEEDRKVEEQLLEQLMNYVSRRNKIVEKMEEDRIREKEEDHQIQMVMMAQGLSKNKKKKAGKKNSSPTTFYD